MANRFPLVINNSTTVVGELQAGDSLNLTSSGIFDGSTTGTNAQYLKSTGSNGVVWGSPGDVYLTTTQTILNKTFTSCSINGLTNTLSNIPNASLINSTITINGTAISLGGTVTTPDNNATYTLATVASGTANTVVLRLTGAGAGGLTSQFNLSATNINVVRQVSGDITLSPNLNTLTFGSFLTGGSYTGTVDRTIAVDATSLNTASKVVARDASGNFSAGNITATQFTRSGGTSSQFLKADGSVDSTAYLPATFSPNDGTLTLNTTGTGISGSQTFTANQSTNVTFTVTSNATSTGVVSGTLVARGTNGDFTAGNITGTSFIRSGGTSSQFLKADGSVDSTTYLPSTFSPNNGTLTLEVSGVGLSGSQTFTANQSTNATFTVTSNATSNNTGSTIVARNASGDFTARNITASQFVRSGGTASQFLKADGSVDSNTYITSVGNGTISISGGTGISANSSFSVNQTGNTTVSIGIQGSVSGARYSCVPYVAGDGVMEIGRYIDFHNSSGDGSDFTYRLDNNANGSLIGSGSISANSDVRLKKNITTITNSLEKVLSLRGVEYDRIDNNEHQIGLIAQEVEKVIPCLVTESNSTGMKAVAYSNVVSVLIEAIKEQQLQIEDLKTRINNLESK